MWHIAKKLLPLSLCILFIPAHGMHYISNWLSLWKSHQPTQPTITTPEVAPTKIDHVTKTTISQANNDPLLLEKPASCYDFALDPKNPQGIARTSFYRGNNFFIDKNKYPIQEIPVDYPKISYNSAGTLVGYKAKSWDFPFWLAKSIQIHSTKTTTCVEIPSPGYISGFAWHPTNPELLALCNEYFFGKQASGFAVYRIDQESCAAKKTCEISASMFSPVIGWSNIGWAVNAHKSAIVALYSESPGESQKDYVGQWDVNGQLLTKWQVPPEHNTSALRVSPLGSLAALTDFNHDTILLYDLESGTKVQHINPTNGGWICGWSGNCLAIAQYDKSIVLWDISAQKPLTSIKLNDDYIIDGAFSNDGHYFGTVSCDNVLSILDMKTLKQNLISTGGYNLKMAWTADNSKVHVMQSYKGFLSPVFQNIAGYITDYDIAPSEQ